MSTELRSAWRRWAGAALMVLLWGGQPARAVSIDWVTVGDAGNADDTTFYGGVAYEYRIMKYEWTNSQYVEYLNAVDPDGTNPGSIYDSLMASNARGGITFSSGSAAGSKYSVRTDMGDKPVNMVNWFDAARVANWLHNGAQTYQTTVSGSTAIKTGAYTLNGSGTGSAVARNAGAKFYVPTEDEWYKAAYYKGGGTNAGYWDYATQSDSTPASVTADAVGNGSAGSTGNSANYNFTADWNSVNGNATTVGTNGGPSAYGTFDQTGNAIEINDLTGTAGATRGVRGGHSTGSTSTLAAGYRGTQDADNTLGTASYSFRLAATVVTVPEPSTWMAAVTGLAAAGWHVSRRKKRPGRLLARAWL